MNHLVIIEQAQRNHLAIIEQAQRKAMNEVEKRLKQIEEMELNRSKSMIAPFQEVKPVAELSQERKKFSPEDLPRLSELRVHAEKSLRECKDKRSKLIEEQEAIIIALAKVDAEIFALTEVLQRVDNVCDPEHSWLNRP